MAPRKGKQQQEQVQVVSLGPQVKEGENVFGVAHIFASFNDTFVHVTDLSGRYSNDYLLRICINSSVFVGIIHLRSNRILKKEVPKIIHCLCGF